MDTGSHNFRGAGRGWGRRLQALLVNFVLPITLAWLAVFLAPRKPPAKAASPGTPQHSGFGVVRLQLQLPGTSAGIPEPIMVCGQPGLAALVYLRLLPHSRALIGVEFWGAKALESEPFAVANPEAIIDVACYLPAFFPPEDNEYWGTLANPLRHRRRSQFLFTVNGVARLDGALVYPLPLHSDLYFGFNPLGGSLVSNRFTGQVLRAAQVE